MKTSAILLAAAGFLAALVSAVPLQVDELASTHEHNIDEHLGALAKRDPGNGTMVVDVGVLNYALTLEHLEATFYVEGLKKFKKKDFLKAGLPEGTFEIFETIRDHEVTHVKVLTEILGSHAVPACKYDFGYKDLGGFLAVARALENTGVSAYDGAVGQVMDKGHLTAAATIATIEARHSSYLNYITTRFPISDAFDVALDMKQVVTIAGAFIKSCPYDLGVVPHPRLIIVVIIEEFRRSGRHHYRKHHSSSSYSSSDSSSSSSSSKRSYDDDSSRKHHDSDSSSKHYDDDDSSRKHHDSDSSSKHYDDSSRKHHDSDSSSKHYDDSSRKHHDSDSSSKHYDDDDSSRKHHDSDSSSKHYDDDDSSRKHHDSSSSWDSSHRSSYDDSYDRYSHRSSSGHSDYSPSSFRHSRRRPIIIIIVEFIPSESSPKRNLFCTWLHGSGVNYTKLNGKKCTVPKEAKGNVYLFITSEASAPNDSNTVAGPSILTVAW